MDANLNEYHERGVLSNDKIIKVYSSDREDGCPKNSVNILYWRKFTDSFYILPFHQQWGKFIYECIGIYKCCKYRINDIHTIQNIRSEL